MKDIGIDYVIYGPVKSLTRKSEERRIDNRAIQLYNVVKHCRAIIDASAFSMEEVVEKLSGKT